MKNHERVSRVIREKEILRRSDNYEEAVKCQTL
jgi:hypothetical protein